MLVDTQELIDSWGKCMFLCGFPFFFLSFLPLEKDEKPCFNVEIYDFDQQTTCEAPVHWSTYPTARAARTKLWKSYVSLEKTDSCLVCMHLILSLKIITQVQIKQTVCLVNLVLSKKFKKINRAPSHFV